MDKLVFACLFAFLQMLPPSALAQTTPMGVLVQGSGRMTQLEADEPPAMPDNAESGVAVGQYYIGRNVYNEEGEKIGAVEDVVLDPQGEMDKFVISVGGFLGIGSHDVAISKSMLSQEDGKLVLHGYTKEQLKELPAARM